MSAQKIQLGIAESLVSYTLTPREQLYDLLDNETLVRLMKKLHRALHLDYTNPYIDREKDAIRFALILNAGQNCYYEGQISLKQIQTSFKNPPNREKVKQLNIECFEAVKSEITDSSAIGHSFIFSSHLMPVNQHQRTDEYLTSLLSQKAASLGSVVYRGASFNFDDASKNRKINVRIANSVIYAGGLFLDVEIQYATESLDIQNIFTEAQACFFNEVLPYFDIDLILYEG